MSMRIGNVPCMDYTADHDDQAKTRSWTTKWRIKGEVKVSFEGLPKMTDETTPVGPRVDIRGGLIGTGSVFVPTVLLAEEDMVDLVVRWNLTDRPNGTRAERSNGKDEEVSRIGTTTDLVTSIYAISPSLHSWTDPSVPYYGFYWLINPPSHLVQDPGKMAKDLSTLFTEYASWFQDPGSSYRIFLREPPRGYGVPPISGVSSWSGIGVCDWVEMSMMSRVVARSWISSSRMRWCTIGQSCKVRVATRKIPIRPGITRVGLWKAHMPAADDLNSGVAEYYPSYELGMISESRFVAKLNTVIAAYYTAPAINLSSIESTGEAWSDTHAQRMPYLRGAVYLLHLDAGIRQTSDGKHSLRDPVLEIRRLRAGQSYGFAHWSTIIHRFLGDDAAELYANMSAGAWIVPPPNNVSSGLQEKITSQELYERGFEIHTEGDQSVIRDLVRGYRAEEAGIRDGDVILWNK